MKRALKFFQGCLVVVGIGLVGLVLMAVSFRLAGPIEERETTADLEQPIAVTPEQLAAEGLVPGEARSGRRLSAHIFMEEGKFQIKPGPPGSAIRVEGDYDAGSFDLQQELTEGENGEQIYNLSFRARYSIISRLLRSGFQRIEGLQNQLTVYLPRDVPMTLNAQFRKGESELELGGLAISSAHLDLEMGEHTVRVSEANPVSMDALEVRSGMGEIELFDLGRLGAGQITFWGKMGEVDLDLGGEIVRDTKLFARMRMGEMKVSLPYNSELSVRDSVFLGEKESPPASRGRTGDYKLDVDIGLTMGELRYSFR